MKVFLCLFFSLSLSSSSYYNINRLFAALLIVVSYVAMEMSENFSTRTTRHIYVFEEMFFIDVNFRTWIEIFIKILSLIEAFK